MPYGVHINGMRCSDLNADGTEVVTNIIFVGGLSPNTNKESLRAFFGQFGYVKDCSVVVKGRAPGFGFVHFNDNSTAEKACGAGMLQLHGRWLEVRKAIPDNKTGPVVPVTPGLGSSAPRRASSPRSLREEFLQSRGLNPGSNEAGKSRRKSSTSSSNSSSSSTEKKRKHTKKAKKKKSRQRSSSSSTSSSVCITAGMKSAATIAAMKKEPVAVNPEIEKAKHEALQRLMTLKSLEAKDARMKEWRLLLREWHPDKNPDRVEIATAVFQYLQKGKWMLESE